MNGLGKPFRKKSDPKNKKNSKNQSENAACEQKTTTEKPNFCSNTIFALYFKIRAKKIHAAKALAFSLHFLFRRDQNHYSNLTSKIMKMCKQILKKKTAPQYDSNSLKCNILALMYGAICDPRKSNWFANLVLPIWVHHICQK